VSNIDYEIELFVDFLITRDNTEEIMNDYKQEILDTFDYQTTLLVSKKIATSKLYTEDQIYNFRNVLHFVMENKFIKEKNLKQIKGLIDLIYEVASVEPTYDFYYEEFTSKYNNLDMFINSDCQMISKKEMDLSVQYDYFAYKYLTSPVSLTQDFNLVINQNFILSINKFLSEIPEIFLDKEIKNKTINSLNLIIAYCEENESEINIDQIKSLINLVSLNADPVDIDLIKYYNLTLLIRKIMVDNRKIEDTEYKEMILTDYFIENLKETLQILERNGTSKYYKYEIKERLEYVLTYILNHRNDNKTKINHNEMKYLLNKMQFSKLNYFLYDEAALKYTGFEFVKQSFIKWIFGSNISLEEDMKTSIARDYDALQILLSKEELDENKIDPYYVRSIKKFQMDMPQLFYSEQVLKKAEKILTSEKVLKKR